MTKHTEITTPGGENLVMVPAAEYQKLTARAEDIAEAALAAEGRGGPVLSAEAMRAIFDGTLHPLTAWRKAAGLTQTALAEKAGTRQATIADIENGRITDPRVKTVKALAEALGVEIENLLPPD